MRRSRATVLGAGLLVGALGGAACVAAGYPRAGGPGSAPGGVVLGGVYGLLFALLAGRRARGPGAGLLWGLAFALLLWLAGPVGLVPLLAGTPARFCDCGEARAQ